MISPPHKLDVLKNKKSFQKGSNNGGGGGGGGGGVGL